MDKEIVLKLTGDEANELASLIDIAVKVRGLEVAYSGVNLFNKLKAAATTAEALTPPSSSP